MSAAYLIVALSWFIMNLVLLIISTVVYRDLINSSGQYPSRMVEESRRDVKRFACLTLVTPVWPLAVVAGIVWGVGHLTKPIIHAFKN